MSMRSVASAIALWASASATLAQAATPPPCLTRSEANGLFTAILPDMLNGIGTTCATVLPENATLRTGLPALVAKYRPASDAAWPQAMAAIGKLGGKELAGLDPALVRSMAGPMIGGVVSQGIKPADCATIDRAVALLTPLPADNLAELFVLLAELGMRDKKDAPFTICKAEQAALPAAGTTTAR